MVDGDSAQRCPRVTARGVVTASTRLAPFWKASSRGPHRAYADAAAWRSYATVLQLHGRGRAPRCGCIGILPAADIEKQIETFFNSGGFFMEVANTYVPALPFYAKRLTLKNVQRKRVRDPDGRSLPSRRTCEAAPRCKISVRQQRE